MRLARWGGRAAVIVALAAVLATPWLWERFFVLEIVGVAALLAFSVGRSGWQGEAQILATVALALAGAFHWAPVLLAGAMRAHWSLGVLAAAPFVLWDAARVSLPGGGLSSGDAASAAGTSAAIGPVFLRCAPSCTPGGRSSGW